MTTPSAPMADALAEGAVLTEKSRYNPRPARRGVITAGDIDDTLNLAAFAAYQRGAAKALSLPRANLAQPIRAQLTTRRGFVAQIV